MSRVNSAGLSEDKQPSTRGLADYLSLVKFSHSVFALPFAMMGAWLAAGGVPSWDRLVWIGVALVAARTSAMGFNRLVDREQDARNPRTAGRELPAGVLGVNQVRAMILIASAIFVGASFALSTWCGWLSLPVLACLLAYSYFKRFSASAHLFLGFCLGLAPLGAWLAVRGDFQGDWFQAVLLAAVVTTWVAGFDLIYACQDAEFDREAGLHSVPARFGVPAALGLSSALHVVTVGLLAGLAWRAETGPVFWIAIALVALLLIAEHRVVRPDDLSRVNLAFFTLNGWVGLGLFVGLALDLQLGASLV